MEKISNILPSSPRIRTVDMTNAPAMRPGTPSFGVPMGSSALTDRVSFSAAAMSGEPALPSWKDKDNKMAKIVENVASNFMAAPALMETAPEVRSSGNQEQTLKHLERQQMREAVKPLAEQRMSEFFNEAPTPVEVIQSDIEATVSPPRSPVSIRA